MANMSRPNTISRNLSLTEELEKLEQSITLTLQEIDHNFSRAHRIVTTSILPIVEQYAEHSSTVWEGSKFWKQFFEASANVSLSGFEELAADKPEDETVISQSQDGNTTYSISQAEEETIQSGDEEERTYGQGNDSLLDNDDVSGSTPRAPQFRSGDEKPKFADYPSSYENLRRELKGKAVEIETYEDEDDSELLPTTPSQRRRLPKMSMTPESSPFDSNSYITKKNLEQVLLRKVLDKTFQVTATIHTTPATAKKQARTPANKPAWRDTMTPLSSPPIAAPELHSDIFSSPIRIQFDRAAPRTPGVSVQTPARAKTRDALAGKEFEDEITWESSDEEELKTKQFRAYDDLGLSPQKLVQFDVPQSRLMQTPARDVGKRIVADLLMTAGAGVDSDEGESPSVVKMQNDLLDDSF